MSQQKSTVKPQTDKRNQIRRRKSRRVGEADELSGMAFSGGTHESQVNSLQRLALAGINLYLFGRVLGLRRIPALYAGVVYMFSGFLIVSVVFTMFLAAVPWLPLLLAVIEFIIRKQEEKGVA